MAFKEKISLEADVTISLGGVNKKTGKANPKQVEGYYLGRKQVVDNKKKSGFSYIYFFQTAKGNIGVWGKTNMDNKMADTQTGVMTRITFDKMQPTPNGDMYVYKVECDHDNIIDVGTLAESEQADSTYDDGTAGYAEDGEEEERDADEDEAPVDEIKPARTAARPTATAPDAARQAKVQALLNGKGRRTA